VKLKIYEEERPVAVQIFGANEDVMDEAARISESVNPDFIDINCGCWVKDVALRGAGAGLLKDIPKMRRIAEAVMRNVSLPVTLKTRLGWDENSIVIVDVAKMLEDIGIQALTVHCRLRGQGNKGEADWSWIKRIKDSGVTIPVVLNGNIKTPEDVKSAFEKYEPDAVMIGQGAINNPWIFNQAKSLIKDGSYIEPAISEKIDVCMEHLKLCCELKGERYGTMEFRKHYSGYLRNLPGVSKLRMELMPYLELEPILEKLENYKTVCRNAVERVDSASS
jgi:tRNA-dihydrouridine synthase B